MEESHGHDVNSAAGLILMCPKTRRVLLALRSGDEEYQGGTWCTLGGMMQNLERPLEAALREAMEEGEIKPDNTVKQAIFVDETKGKGEDPGFKFYSFIGIVNDEYPVTINDEHEDYNWFRLSELPTLKLHPGVTRLMADTGSSELVRQHICGC